VELPTLSRGVYGELLMMTVREKLTSTTTTTAIEELPIENDRAIKLAILLIAHYALGCCLLAWLLLLQCDNDVVIAAKME
jgi:hypothetical protein